ncbi:MAG: TolC family protein [Acidobacteria bacterium]|nr:TolC family protein [Acidobacteriota bacterium]
MKLFVYLLVAISCQAAETHRLDLKAALKRAMEQSPEVLLSRFDESNAQQAVQIARDPFTPKLAVGSGLAYTYGFPMSIEGSAPSLFQVKASQSIINRPQSYLLAKAKVDASGAQQMTHLRRDEVLERTAKLFLDADRAARNLKIVLGQIQNLEEVLKVVQARLDEGRILPIELQRADINLKKARQRQRILAVELKQTEHNLAFVLGFESEDRVETISESAMDIPTATSPDAVIREALDNSRELKKLQIDLQSKTLEAQSNRSAWMPQVDLIAQYALFSRFNNLDQYFNRFQTNNAQLGVSFKFPIAPGPATAALAMQAQNEVSRLRLRVSNTRNRIEMDTRKLYEDLQLHKENRELAKLDLDLARDQIAIHLAQMEEGKATRRQVEESRFMEAEKWLAYWDAQYMFDRARISLLAATGGLMTLAAN